MALWQLSQSVRPLVTHGAVEFQHTHTQIYLHTHTHLNDRYKEAREEAIPLQSTPATLEQRLRFFATISQSLSLLVPLAHLTRSGNMGLGPLP